MYEFPEGTIFFKELQLTVPGTNPDGSRTEASGRGYHEPKAATAKAKPKSECAFCHIATAKEDGVWTQFYPLLDK